MALVALSEVDHANMALSQLGISTGIASFNDPSPEAKTLSFWYPKCRDQLLRSAPWNFADTYIPLVSDGSQVPNVTGGTVPSLNFAYPGWQFTYQYPSDCLQAVAVTTIAGVRNGTLMWANFWFPFSFGLNITIPKMPFKVSQSTANPGQRMVLCDLPSPAYLMYIQGVTNTAMFDVMFSDGLSNLLAYKAGGALRANVQRVQAAGQAAEQTRLSALAQALNEAQQDPARDSPSTQARY